MAPQSLDGARGQGPPDALVERPRSRRGAAAVDVRARRPVSPTEPEFRPPSDASRGATCGVTKPVAPPPRAPVSLAPGLGAPLRRQGPGAWLRRGAGRGLEASGVSGEGEALGKVGRARSEWIDRPRPVTLQPDGGGARGPGRRAGRPLASAPRGTDARLKTNSASH